LSDQNYGRFCDRLRVVEYHQFLGVSRAAINRYFNLIGVSLTVPLALLAQTLPKSNRRMLEVVRESALNAELLICAVDAPFDEKDTLRDRG